MPAFISSESGMPYGLFVCLFYFGGGGALRVRLSFCLLQCSRFGANAVLFSYLGKEGKRGMKSESGKKAVPKQGGLELSPPGEDYQPCLWSWGCRGAVEGTWGGREGKKGAELFVRGEPTGWKLVLPLPRIF